jgi:hypothetical protein
VTTRQAHAKPARSQREGCSFLRRRIPTASFPSLWFSHFLPDSCPSAIFQTHIFLDLLHLPLPSSTSPSPRDQNRTRSLSVASHLSYTSRFPQSQKRLASFFIVYPLQLLASVLRPFRIVSFDTHVHFDLMKISKLTNSYSKAREYKELLLLDIPIAYIFINSPSAVIVLLIISAISAALGHF